MSELANGLHLCYYVEKDCPKQAIFLFIIGKMCDLNKI